MKTNYNLKLLISAVLSVTTFLQTGAQDDVVRLVSFKNFDHLPTFSCLSGSFICCSLENKFFFKEFMDAEAKGCYIVGRNFLPFSIRHYGSGAYGRLDLCSGYGRSFGKSFAMSFRIFYIFEHARHYPSRHSFCLDVGFMYRLNRKTLLSANIYNPFMLNYGLVSKQPIPIVFTVGTMYQFSQELTANILIQKYLPGNWIIKGGICFQPFKKILTNLECSNYQVGLDFGFVVRCITFSVGVAWHYRLSFSPHLDALYSFNNYKTSIFDE